MHSRTLSTRPNKVAFLDGQANGSIDNNRPATRMNGESRNAWLDPCGRQVEDRMRMADFLTIAAFAAFYALFLLWYGGRSRALTPAETMALQIGRAHV